MEDSAHVSVATRSAASASSSAGGLRAAGADDADAAGGWEALKKEGIFGQFYSKDTVGEREVYENV